jgi:hypothetical protein
MHKGWVDGILFPTGSRDISLLHSVQIGAIQSPIQWELVTLSSEVKQPGHNADHPSPCSADVKDNEAIPLLPHTFSHRGA